ncbi:SpoIID/LytB domain-containing protein [Nocardioides mangrovi]|uniref:SpoIID/LytB domain-containing protein n=1 Tax=Nocardioides mangrovi TaxID=2874580 RepID=A0ABS7UJU7_9ACTN|nr:SpoIID/LytB domain-containing protein [Nocardioides mangrovi]MBZ5740862.1 SpoIID/LytB domain-containing protein [Nocardioides mangrovi]
MRRALLALLTAGIASVVGLPAAQAAPDSWSVPGQATITIRGHGYGHGHGMSQYGAEGAARQGLTYRQIVDFYYPGTTWGTAKGRVTVLISADTTDDLVVEARSGLTVRDLAGGARVTLPDNGARQWKVATGRDGVTRVSFLTKKWHRWQALEGQGEFAAGGKPVTLVTPSGTTAYRGKLRTAVTLTGHTVTVNALTLDNYLRGVVPLEMPALWSPDAVRAQAVAARTYAAYERRHPQASVYQLCDTSSCQVYGGYGAEHPASNDAVTATRRQVLLSGGQPAFTQFGSSSGGWTCAGSVSYLPAQRDTYDDWSGNPVHDWKTTITDATIERAWPGIGNLSRIAVRGRDGNGVWGGRVSSVLLVGSDGRTTISGDTFRSALGLRSTWITFKVASG